VVNDKGAEHTRYSVEPIIRNNSGTAPYRSTGTQASASQPAALGDSVLTSLFFLVTLLTAAREWDETIVVRTLLTFRKAHVIL